MVSRSRSLLMRLGLKWAIKMIELITKDDVRQAIERYNCCGYVEERADILFKAITDIPSVNSKLHELVVYALNILNEAWGNNEIDCTKYKILWNAISLIEEYFLHTNKEY